MKRFVLVAIALSTAGFGCSSNSGSSSGTGGATAGTGGATGSGGATGGTGGATGSGGSSVVGTGGSAVGTGGSGIGGAGTGTGGTAVGTGGAGVAGAGGTPVPCQAPIAITGGTAATVTVNLGTTLSTVSPDMMGIHTSVYDGSIGSPTTAQELRAAGIKSLRYPGGSYGDLYHWETHSGTSTPTSGAGSNVVYVAMGSDFGHFVSVLQNVGASALITVNYGTNPAGTGPGVPQEAAAWVAYANGDPADTKVIGLDSSVPPIDWHTVGYWASLRAAAPLLVDDGRNLLRISHPAPVGVKYWEIGNELYGNGYYYGGCGWEPDMHLAYPAPPATTCPAGRMNAAALGPAAYGAGVRAFSAAMKAVDPTVQIGAIAHWPYNEYSSTVGRTDWNNSVLPQACMNGAIDFVVNHWYAGSTLASLLTIPSTDIPAMYAALRAALMLPANGCGAKGATMPIAVTEWGPNGLQSEIGAAFSPPQPAAPALPVPPTHTQIAGIFAAESYANFMQQGALAAHWLELHNDSYLPIDPTTGIELPGAWGYHGALIAHYLADGGDRIVQATVSNAGTLMTSLFAHASLHADGGISVMLTNTSSTATANVTVNVAGGTSTFACVGARYAYTPATGSTDLDGSVAGQPIFATTAGDSVPVAVPPYSVVTVAFPKHP